MGGSVRKPMQRITPFLWFDHQAEEAATFYVSIFKTSRITSVARYDDAAAKASGRPKGSVMTVAFELDGQEFTALNSGLQIHRGDIARRELRDAGRSRSLLGEALGGRPGSSMRVA